MPNHLDDLSQPMQDPVELAHFKLFEEQPVPCAVKNACASRALNEASAASGSTVANSKTGQCLPNIPVEIWDDIIEFATYIPGAYSLFDYFKIEAFCKDIHGISVGNAFKETMTTQLALSKTSRFLNNIVRRFIFRYIRITSAKQFMALRMAIGTSGEEGIFGKGLRRWTIRIELALEEGLVWTDEHRTAMSRLLVICQSMTCFSTLFTSIPDGQLGLPAILYCLQNHPLLKRLETRMNGDIGRSLYSLRSSLEVLCWRGRSRNSIRHEFPRLRVLITNSDSGTPKQINAPKLRACIVASGDETRTTTPQPDVQVDGDVVEYLSPCLIEKNKLRDLPKWTSLKALRFTYRSLVDWECTWPDKGSVVSNLDCLLIDISLDRRANGTRGRLGNGNLRRNLEQLTCQETFPSLKTFKFFLPVQSPELAGAYVPDEHRYIWRNWLAGHSRGKSLLVSQGMKEWVGDYWLELDGEKIFELLFLPLDRIEQELAGTWAAKNIWKRFVLKD